MNTRNRSFLLLLLLFIRGMYELRVKNLRFVACVIFKQDFFFLSKDKSFVVLKLRFQTDVQIF